jgi:DNA transformation protein
MTASPEFRAYLLDQFAAFGPVAIRPMFGGAGVYFQEVMFALVADDTLYLRVGNDNRADFEAYGAKPFIYQHKTNARPVAMPYWELPPEVLEDSDELALWAGKALAAAHAAKTAATRTARPRKRAAP